MLSLFSEAAHDYPRFALMTDMVLNVNFRLF